MKCTKTESDARISFGFAIASLERIGTTVDDDDVFGLPGWSGAVMSIIAEQEENDRWSHSSTNSTVKLALY